MKETREYREQLRFKAKYLDIYEITPTNREPYVTNIISLTLLREDAFMRKLSGMKPGETIQDRNRTIRKLETK